MTRMRQIAIEDAKYVAAGRRVDCALVRTRLWLIISAERSAADSWAKAGEACK